MRKKWTAKTEISDSIISFREKKKWQIALRRYVLERNKSSYYAPFFGLDYFNLRRWIEIQFELDLNWNNFSKDWQFDHVLPITYFDFNDENDLKLCWNFVNIRVDRHSPISKKGNRLDVLSAKPYFKSLYEHTGHPICQKLVQKIELIESTEYQLLNTQITFLSGNKNMLSTLAAFDSQDFDKLNEGAPLSEILALKDILKRFGNPDEEYISPG